MLELAAGQLVPGLVTERQVRSADLFTPTATMVRPLRFFSWHSGARQ